MALPREVLRDHPAVASCRAALEAAEDLYAQGSQKGRGRGLGAEVNFSDIETALRHSGRVRSNEGLVMLDCRGFADAVEQDRFHLGSDPKKQQRLSESRQFPSWVRSAKTAIMQATRGLESGPPLCVACFCRKGCHRSVALTLLLERTLSTLPEFLVLEDTDHLSRHVVWGRGHCRLEACAQCQNMNKDARRTAEATLLRIWAASAF